MIRFKLKNAGDEDNKDDSKVTSFGTIVDLDETKYNAIEV